MTSEWQMMLVGLMKYKNIKIPKIVTTVFYSLLVLTFLVAPQH